MPINPYTGILLLLVSMMVSGCRHTPVSENVDTTTSTVSVHLTPKEIRRNGIQCGLIQRQSINKWACLTGQVVIPHVYISCSVAPADGRISKLCCKEGQYVKAGDILAILENSDFLILQQEYLEAANQFEFFKAEYARQGELTVENATSMKKMQMARRDFQSAEMKHQVLQTQLEMLGIHPDSIRYDHILPHIEIRSLRAGRISRLNFHQGYYIKKGEELCTLVTSNDQHIKFQIPEQYLPQLDADRPVEFYPAFDSTVTCTTKISTIIPEIDPDSHTAIAYAGIPECHAKLIPGMTVKARILYQTDTAFLVKTNAIIHLSEEDYVFAVKNGTFLKIPVKTGLNIGDKTFIVNMPTGLPDSIVISGTGKLNTYFQ